MAGGRILQGLAELPRRCHLLPVVLFLCYTSTLTPLAESITGQFQSSMSTSDAAQSPYVLDRYEGEHSPRLARSLSRRAAPSAPPHHKLIDIYVSTRSWPANSSTPHWQCGFNWFTPCSTIYDALRAIEQSYKNGTLSSDVRKPLVLHLEAHPDRGCQVSAGKQPLRFSRMKLRADSVRVQGLPVGGCTRAILRDTKGETLIIINSDTGVMYSAPVTLGPAWIVFTGIHFRGSATNRITNALSTPLLWSISGSVDFAVDGCVFETYLDRPAIHVVDSPPRFRFQGETNFVQFSIRNCIFVARNSVWNKRPFLYVRAMFSTYHITLQSNDFRGQKSAVYFFRENLYPDLSFYAKVQLSIFNCTFAHIAARYVILLDGCIAENCSVTIHDTTFQGCFTAQSPLVVRGNWHMTCRACLFRDNVIPAETGCSGGIYWPSGENPSGSIPGQFTLVNCTFLNNSVVRTSTTRNLDPFQFYCLRSLVLSSNMHFFPARMRSLTLINTRFQGNRDLTPSGSPAPGSIRWPLISVNVTDVVFDGVTEIM